MPRPKGGPGMGPVEKAKDFKGTIKKLLASLGKLKAAIIVVVVFAIASTVFAIIGPKILGTATNEIFAGFTSKLGGGSGINFGKVHSILTTLLILYVISSVLSYVQGYIMSIVTQKYTYRLREELSNKIHKLPFGYFDHKQNGEVLSVFTNDIDTLQMSLNQVITQLITSITTIIGVLVMMLTINIPLTIVSIVLIPISVIFMALVMKKSQKHFKDNQKYLAAVNGNVEEMYSGHNVVKAFNAERKMLHEFDKNNKKLYTAGWKSQFLGGLIHPIMIFISNLNYVLVSILGGYLAMKGKIKVGDITSFIAYTKNLNQPITSIGQVASQIQSMIAAERIFTFLDAAEEEYKGTKLFDDVEGNVSFNNIKFGYNSDRIIIKNFSAKVKAGQKIAIVGPTGAGKTTIVKLLMNFYHLNDGSITIDGVDINDYDIHELRKGIGMVLQDTWLYSGTIMENLRYGNLAATDEEVIEAAKIANVHHFIKTLPDGYNMVIDEEVNNISQGQKQLLTIARTILSKSKILILDEATSNVDTRTEELIQSAMDKLMIGKTSFIIAHRLSTIKNADLILVMDDGDIVEIGNHQELLNKNGFYANLYNSQFQK